MNPIPILRHVPHEPAGTLENALTDAGLEFRYVDLFDASHSPSTPDLKTAPGLVVMGGPMNVDETEKHPFLAAELDWIRRPTSGTCPYWAFAWAHNCWPRRRGKGLANGVKEIGWYGIELTPAAAEDRLFAGCGKSLTVFQWHGDTLDLPPTPCTWPQARRAGIRLFALAIPHTACNSTSR